jgi:hypothetical protein
MSILVVFCNPLLRPLKSRIDLRNHRKILVIDGRITYCGSQNCADPEFLIKAKYAPWVDAMMRFEGPIAAWTPALSSLPGTTRGSWPRRATVNTPSCWRPG